MNGKRIENNNKMRTIFISIKDTNVNENLATPNGKNSRFAYPTHLFQCAINEVPKETES